MAKLMGGIACSGTIRGSTREPFLTFSRRRLRITCEEVQGVEANRRRIRVQRVQGCAQKLACAQVRACAAGDTQTWRSDGYVFRVQRSFYRLLSSASAIGRGKECRVCLCALCAQSDGAGGASCGSAARPHEWRYEGWRWPLRRVLQVPAAEEAGSHAEQSD